MKHPNFKKICEQFKFQGLFKTAVSYGDGHINDTYKVTYVDDYEEPTDYILQRINHIVFKKTEQLMMNIENITSYLSDMVKEMEIENGYEVLTLVKTVHEHGYFVDSEGNYWRSYVFVKNATGHTFASDNNMLYEAGKAFGQFQLMLKDYPVDSLFETIQDFHHTVNRYKNFEKAVCDDVLNRTSQCLDLIEFVKNRQPLTNKILTALEVNHVPYRVTHNDTKLNNVLIDDVTGIGRCVIDLDTVMPGSALYDFGDAIRSCGSTVSEDEEDLSLLHFDLDRFEAYTKGFLEILKDELSVKEKVLLPFSAVIMTLECGMRFLTDYLEGDLYFKIHKEDHNLIRARNQFKFVEEMEKHLDEMMGIVNTYC